MPVAELGVVASLLAIKDKHTYVMSWSTYNGSLLKLLRSVRLAS